MDYRTNPYHFVGQTLFKKKMCRMLFHLVRNEYLQSQLINICNVNKPSLDNGSIFQAVHRYIEITERNLKKKVAVNSFAVNFPENKVFFPLYSDEKVRTHNTKDCT